MEAKPLDRLIECVLFVAGLAFGSFLNVCISRIPRDESIVRPPSHCRACGRPIRWYDNIPVLGFLLLRGHCRACGSPISYRYPSVELLTALVFTACYVWYGPTWLALKFCIFGFLLIGLIFMDAETGLLPREFTYSGIVIGLAFSWIAYGDSSATRFLLLLFGKRIPDVHWLSLMDCTLAALFGAGFFYFAWALYYLARKRHGMGFGDIALMAMSGAFLGLKLTALVMFCAPIVAVLYIVVLLVREAFRPKAGDSAKQTMQTSAEAESRPLSTSSGAEASQLQSSDVATETVEQRPFLQREIPFGVFLGACSLATIFFGEAAWRWYLGKLHM